MENLAGVIKFTADIMAAEEEKPYIPVFCDVSQKTLSEFMLDRWRMKVPDVMISIVTGIGYTKNLPEDYAVALQSGLTKVVNTSNAWIITHGFNTGVVKLVGEAVRDEQDKRTVYKKKTVRRYNKRVSQITLIGICTDSLVNELEAFQGSESSSGRRRVELDLADEKPARQKQNLDPFHTHYVIVNGSTGKSLATFRTDLEKELQRFSSCRKSFGSGFTENSSDEDDSHSVVRPPTDNTTISRMGVPLVALMVQGGPHEIYQVWNYIKNQTPVVVVKGSGLAADLFSFVYEEVANSGDIDKSIAAIQPEVLKRLVTMFPRLKQAKEEEKLDYCAKLLDCVRMEANEEQHYVTILDLTRASSDLQDLDLYILRAIFASQKSQELDWREQMKRDLVLTLQWNRPDFAREEIMQRLSKVKVDKDVFRLALIMKNRESFVDLILRQGFKTHKFLSHKALIDLFRHAEDTEFFAVNVLGNLLGYPPGTQVDEQFLLKDLNWVIVTFTRVEHFINCYELSTNSCGIYSTEPTVAERKSLNALLVWSVLMGRHELATVLWKYVEDPIPTAVFVSAMWNGLSKFCREPELENQIREWGRNFGVMGMDVLSMAYKESLERTFDLLDREFPDFGRRTPVQLAYDAHNRWFLAHPCCQKWINKIYLGHIQLASSHPGAIHIPDFIKVLLSAFLIFPMFFWIHFPSLDSVEAKRLRLKRSHNNSAFREHRIPINTASPASSKAELLDRTLSSMSQPDLNESCSLMGSSGAVHSRDINSKKTWLMQLQDDQQLASKSESKRRLFRRLFFGVMSASPNEYSLKERVYLLWTAPITKFWTFQFFYWLYLLLFSVVTLLPVCVHRIDALLPPTFTDMHGLVAFEPDIVLWCWTLLIVVETFIKNYDMLRTRQFSNGLTKILEMIFMVGFLAAHFVVRVISLQPKFVNAFQARILMCVGLTYFSYRLIGLFFPISDTLGPMLVRIKFMLQVDFLNYLKMVAPFLLAGGVCLQAVLYPDLEISSEVIRRTFHRSFFSLFLSEPIAELKYTQHCEDHRWIRNESEEADYCKAGDYELVGVCPTIGFWSYIVVIQFMVILKLILATLLFALFTATQLRIQSEADAIWKFKRYSVVMEFASRPAVPPPFSVFHYLLQAFRYLVQVFKRKCNMVDVRKRSTCRSLGRRTYRHEDFHYWKGLVREFFRNKDKERRNDTAVQRSVDKLAQIQESLSFQNTGLRHLKDRLGDVETAVSKLQVANDKIAQLEKTIAKLVTATTAAATAQVPPTSTSSTPLPPAIVASASVP